jgi:glucose-6-phosphate 1-dehydrogenase
LDPSPLLRALRTAEEVLDGAPRRLYHLAVPPPAFASVISMLGGHDLARDARVIVEKPFGADLTSAKALNRRLSRSRAARLSTKARAHSGT